MRPLVRMRRIRRGSIPLPSYQSSGAAGLDLMADLDEPTTLAPGARAAISTGFAIEIPRGFEGQVRPRSGRALEEGLSVINSPGTIDADYRGEVKVLLINLGEHPVQVGPGQRIAQLVIAPVARADVVETEELTPSPRGDGGFGHTGR